MFASDNNLFCLNKEIKLLFMKANLELGKMSKWFAVNKLDLQSFISLKMEITYSYDHLL